MNLLYTTAPHSLLHHANPTFPVQFRTGIRRRRCKLLLEWNNAAASCAVIGMKLKNCSYIAAANSSSGNNGGTSFVEESSEDCVEVIAVGSRKDAVLDFCSGSPLLSPRLRFWNILNYDSEQMQLQERFTDRDNTPRTLKDFTARQSSCKAVILVATAAYGSDHITAVEVLRNVKSGNGIAVGIILKPFTFEGPRRQDEVRDLFEKLQKQANFCIVLDTDTLLENDMVTLDEALKTSNNAVLMAMNAISCLLSDKHIKLLNAKDNSTRELKLPEFREILKIHNEARIGFGAGYNVKTSLLQAIKKCPFLGVDLKDFNGVILCIITNAGAVDPNDTNNVVHTVRQVTGCGAEIIVSIVHEPNLEPNSIQATIIVFGYAREQLAPRNGIFSGLGQHFPFVFNIFKKQRQETADSETAVLSKSQRSYEINSPAVGDIPVPKSLDDTNEDKGVFTEIQPLMDDTSEELFSSSSSEGELELSETNPSSSSYELNSEEIFMFKREQVPRGNLDRGYLTEVSTSESNFSEATALVDNISIYRLPVGVKHLEKLEDSPPTNNKHGAEWRTGDSIKKLHPTKPNVTWSRLTSSDFNNNTSSFGKGNFTNNSRKQGVLSTRAASMLESERDSQKKWSRFVEMKYRGGLFSGRSQGGLPEGKGRLLLEDGSIYDGMWRYGKRSGLGTFYFNNGDVYQGSWRDDVMHGKGWLYFHTGDRWFVNFWKGKANGEGRFYSKRGEVFFGHFKEGWRHGRFLRINVDGTRYQELWDEGVLISEKPLDPDAEFD